MLQRVSRVHPQRSVAMARSEITPNLPVTHPVMAMGTDRAMVVKPHGLSARAETTTSARTARMSTISSSTENRATQTGERTDLVLGHLS